MRRLRALLFGIALGGGLVYFGFNFHLVRAQDGWLMVPRTSVALEDACVDVRKWGAADWRKHPALTRDMFKAGYGDKVAASIQDEALNKLGLTRLIDDESSSQ